MDIPHIQPHWWTQKKYWWIAAAALAVAIVALSIARRVDGAAFIADRDTLIFGDVKRGDFAVLVRAPGSLIPKDVRMVTTNVDGRVEQIFARAGSQLKAGDKILQLSNPAALAALDEAQYELNALTAEYRADRLNLQSQLLDLDASALKAKNEFETANYKLRMQESLLDGNVVSRLEHETTRASVESNRARWETEQARAKKMRQGLRASIDAQEARLNKEKNTLASLKLKVESLIVTASIDGTLQEMPLELGQQVTVGGIVGKIARHQQLLGRLRVQEAQIRNIAVGHETLIDTHHSTIKGRVVRIDPAITGGVVNVDIELLDALPPEAKPDLSVDGTIQTAKATNVLYVSRPVFAQSQSKTSVYRITDNGSAAERANVEFGRASTSLIEVLGGLKLGDRIIVSDPSAWEQHKRILIN